MLHSMKMEKKAPLPARPVMITFDDWTPDHFELARPILNQLGFKAVFFIVTEKINSEEERDKLRTLVREGHEIGSHTVHHFYLTQGDCNAKWKCCHELKPCPAEETQSELRESKNFLESVIDRPVTSIAWPGNFYSDRVVKWALEAGYQTTFAVKRQTSKGEVLNSRASVTRTPALIFRTRIDGNNTLAAFIRRLSLPAGEKNPRGRE